MRCLGLAGVDVAVDAQEYEASDPNAPERPPLGATSERASSTWVAWAHDQVALVLPEQILCRPDCAGLCPVCGKNLNDEPHEHEDVVADPRWAALEARDRIGRLRTVEPATIGSRSWPFRRERPRTPAATSAARSTASTRRASDLPELRRSRSGPHRVCPTCKTYRGPRGRPAPRARAVALMATRVAVDALGGDRAPDEIVAGAVEAASDTIAPILFGPASLDRHRARARAVQRRRSRCTTSPPRPCARSPTRPSCAPCARSGTARLTPSSRPGTRARCSPPRCCTSGASLVSPGPAIAVMIPSRRGPDGPDRRGRQRRRAARAPRPVRAHGRRLRARSCSISREPAVRLLSIGEEPEKGNQLTLEAHELLAASGLRFDGNVEGRGPARGRGGRRRLRRLHRQRRPEDARGHDPERDRRAPPRDRAPRRAASSAGC